MPPKASPDGSLLFSGLRFFFVTKAHMQLMMKRVVEQGGTLDDAVVPGETTYIICPPKTSRAVLDAALPPSSTTAKYKLVTQQYVAQSIIKGKRQNEANYRPVVIEPKLVSPAIAAASPTMSQPPAKRQKLQGGSIEDKEQVTVVPTPLSEVSRPPSVTGERGETKEESEEEEEGNEIEPCIVRRQGSKWVAIQGRKPKYTGGNTGIPWGSYGVWDEPFNLEKARETVEKLRKHWYVVVGGGNRNVQNFVEQATTAGESNEENETNPSDNTVDRDDKTTNGICLHAACSKRRFCFIALLEEFKNKVYVPGRDQFKIKAIDKAQQMLIMYKKPLDSDDDVDAVGLGVKSSEKVKELLRTGHMERSEHAGKDERVTAYAEFMKVWGVGPSIAERWYTLGCRTIDDVKKKVKENKLNLTEQQKVGLKYFNDLELKIPREQVAIAESIVREATFELVEQLGAPNPEKTYCFATGSYRRGKPESSDIDILIVLPNSMPIQDCYDFLQRLLTKLIDQKGLLVDEMGPREERGSSHYGGHRSGGSGSGSSHPTHASWMGVCRVPGVETYRRIDFKLYTAQHGATAVNYFANSQAFCRATRYWANTAVPEIAKQLNPIATGIKISDLEMCPMMKRYVGSGNGNGGRKEETVPLEPAVQLTCESDLYEMIGLDYVPVTMRYFHDYF
jgi:DNA polymerase lambda